jgi:hypothetical protein
MNALCWDLSSPAARLLQAGHRKAGIQEDICHVDLSTHVAAVIVTGFSLFVC